MFYLSKNCLSQLVTTYSISKTSSVINNDAQAQIILKKSGEFKLHLIKVLHIEIVSSKYARLVVTDSTNTMYLFIRHDETQILDPNLSSYNRQNNDVNFCLLNNSLIAIEEIFFLPISKLKSEFGNCHADFFLDCENAVIIPLHEDHVTVLSRFSIVGHELHISDPNKKRKGGVLAASMDKKKYLVNDLNINLKESEWYTLVYLVDISPEKVFTIKGSNEKGTFKRFLCRDSTQHIEILVFNELINMESFQSLQMVLIISHYKIIYLILNSL